jgi:hypothetical protein
VGIFIACSLYQVTNIFVVEPALVARHKVAPIVVRVRPKFGKQVQTHRQANVFHITCQRVEIYRKTFRVYPILDR